MPDSSCALRARHLHCTFGQVPALLDVSLDLAWGAVTAIAGPNGAGKSTLVEVLAGVRRPAHGSVECRSSLALVVQRVATPDSLPMTVRDVVALGTWGVGQARSSRTGKAQVRERVDGALERVQLAGLARRPFNELSGGQRQRALLAQGIARQARIFLLDEPAAGLDQESRRRIRAILAAEAARGAAVACVSHDEEDIAAADAVIRLAAGRITGREGP